LASIPICAGVAGMVISMDMRKLLSYVRRIIKIQIEVDKKVLLFTLMLIVFAGIAPAIDAFAMGRIIRLFSDGGGTSYGFSPGVIRQLLFWVGLITTSTLLLIILGHHGFKISTVCSHMVAFKLKTDMFNKMEKVRLDSFDDPMMLDKYNNARNQIDNNISVVISNIIGLLQSLLIIFTLSAVVISVRWWVLLIIFGFSLPSIFISINKEDRFFSFVMGYTNQRRKLGYLSSVLLDHSYQRELRVYGGHNLFKNKFAKQHGNFINESKKILNRDLIGSIVKSSISKLGVAIVFIVIGINVLNGNVNVGDFVMIIAAVAGIQSSFEGIFEYTSTVYGVLLFFEQYDDFMLNQPDVNTGGVTIESSNEMYELAFKNVCFRYPKTDKNVLCNTSFTIKTGMTLAIVGPNGAGKSTIVKLILRMYDVSSGEITLNGVNINNINFEEYMAKISIVFQDYIHYSATLHENITLKQKDITGSVGIGNAVQMANLDEFYANCPQGEDTTLTRQFELEGIEPSVGQWQRIALARALFKNPKCLVLDEPSSAMDPESESAFYEQIFSLKKEKTLIFISHRMVSTLFADQIIYLKNGKVVESGTHNELIKNNSNYAKVFNTQQDLYHIARQRNNLE